MKKNIVILYYSKDVYPLRDTIEKHLYSWRKYSNNRIFYINLAYGFRKWVPLLKLIHIDVVVFHTIFLGIMRMPRAYSKFRNMLSYIKTLDCVKVALPQDEFTQTDILNRFINEFNIHYIFTCAEKKDWKYIYDKIDLNKVILHTVLTGYIDEDTVKKVNKLKSVIKKREIDVGYRAWKVEFSLGSYALHKIKIAQVFTEIAKKLKLKKSISLEEKDVLNGYDWLKFLLNCKTTIGVEAGASVLDKDGKIKEKVNKYLLKYPNATFEKVKELYFKKEDRKLGLKCISPRHFEACITQTCQMLLEGRYSGILVPWKHYLPIKKDYSNATEIMEKAMDDQVRKKIVRQAYQDIVASEKYTYRNFIAFIEKKIIFKKNIKEKTSANNLMYMFFYLKDKLDWQRIKYAYKLSKFF